MQVIAQLNNLRISPRKVRLMSRVLWGMNAMRAKAELDYRAKRSAKPLSKLLDSALANAHNNFGLVKENMIIKQVIVNEGTKLKRYRPKGFGTTSPIEKKTSRIKMILEEKVPGLKRPSAEVKQRVEPTGTSSKKEDVKDKSNVGHRGAKPVENEAQKSGGFKNIKRFFRRKAI